jgi:hypothetical protein
VAATIAEYVANSFMSALLTVAGVLYLLNYFPIPKELRVTAIVLLCGSAGYLIIAFVVLYRRTYVASAIAAAFVDLLGVQRRTAGKLEGLRRVEDTLLSLLRDRPARMARITALEVLAHFLLLIETYWALVSMGLATSLLTAAMAEILTKLANVAFAGVAEGAYALLFHALGLPAAAGFALSLVKRMRSLSFALIGLGILALVPDRLQRST